jgi:excisionase family DNA binding protein
MRQEAIDIVMDRIWKLKEDGLISTAEWQEIRQCLENCETEGSKFAAFPQLFKVSEVARLLDVHRKTVYDYIYAGKLKCCKLGRRSIRITRESLDQLLSGNPNQNDKMR